MSATATAISYEYMSEEQQPPQLPPAVLIPEMQQDILVRHRAARFIGACATGSELQIVSAESEQPPIESLHGAIDLAAHGNEHARAMIQTNALTDVVERTVKAGHIMRVRTRVEQDGSLSQNGQNLRSVNSNSLVLSREHQTMRTRTEAEARNMFRAESLVRQGLLKEHRMVVISRAPKLPDHELKELGFFADTKSFVIQVMSQEGHEVIIESAFVAGVDEETGERQDEAMVYAIGDSLGIDLRGLEPDELIDAPLLVREEAMPNGVADLVKVADEVYGTFFGQNQPRQNYETFYQTCKKREDNFLPRAIRITEQLVREASTITSKEQAILRLHELSEREMVQQAVFDSSIDPRVFGKEAATHIHTARHLLSIGQVEAAQQQTVRAIETADSSSCPLLVKKIQSLQDMLDITQADPLNEDCEFRSNECPLCKTKDVWTKVTKTRISGSCGCSVSKA